MLVLVAKPMIAECVPALLNDFGWLVYGEQVSNSKQIGIRYGIPFRMYAQRVFRF